MPMKIWKVTIEVKDEPKGRREKHFPAHIIFDQIADHLRDLPAGMSIQVLGVKDETP